jgi:cytochrome c biogenesis protein CcmG/thiol:disulfide interchange protein DsbE
MGGKKLLVLVLAGLGASLGPVVANEVLPTLRVNGHTYTNVTVTGVSATDIFFTSTDCVGNAKLKSLDPQLQKRFHYDAARAAQVEQKQAKEAAQYHRQLVRDFPIPTGGATNLPSLDAGKKIWAKSFLGHLAPELFVEEWLTPMPDCRGKFILYDFWDPASPVCRAEIPELNAFQREFSDRLVVIGMADEPADVVRRVADPMIEYPLAIDTQARTEKIVGVTGVPHLMLIDPDGFVRWEGFPFLPGHEFSDQVIKDVMAQYDRYVAATP